MLQKIRNFFKQNQELKVTIYIILQLLVFISMMIQFYNHHYQNVFYCLITIILFIIPYTIDKKSPIILPNTLEIMIFLFIFSTTILGELCNFYVMIRHWDTILHTIHGFLCAAIGFSFINILNHSNKAYTTLTSIFVIFVSLCFSMTIGVFWEFFEFSGDYFFNKDMQKDFIVNKISSVKLNKDNDNIPVIIDNINQTIIYSNNYKSKVVIKGGYLDVGIIDTMKDLFANFIGAVLFSILEIFYIKNNKQYFYAGLFIPKLKEKQ